MSGSAYNFPIKYNVNWLMLKTERLKRKSCEENEMKTYSSVLQFLEEGVLWPFAIKCVF